jgi:tetratricopeptide (TPR) repeat protein
MTRSCLHSRCRMICAAFALLSSLGISVAEAHTPFKVGDSVTAINDAELKTQNSVVGTLATGTTVTVKKIDGPSLLVDADIYGWVPAGNMIPLDAAEAYFNGLVDRSPRDPHNYYFRAGVRQTQGKYDLAVQDYDKAIQLDPKEVAYVVERGVCFLAKKEFARAISDLTAAIKLQPKATNAYIARGGAYCETGDYLSAIADWKTAARLEPNFITPRACLVELLACCPDERFRRGEKAVQFATGLCDETGWQDSQILHYLACAYAECADFDSAIKWEKQAIALNPPDRTGYVANFQKALSTFESRKPLHEFMVFVR